MLMDKNPMERYMAVLETQKINWDSFKFKIEDLAETKVSMISLLFNIISNLDLNYDCLKYFKHEQGGCERNNLLLCKRL